jgi:hypothetical protein
MRFRRQPQPAILVPHYNLAIDVDINFSKCWFLQRLSSLVLARNVTNSRLPYIWIVVVMASQEDKSPTDDVQNTSINRLAHHHIHI